MPSLQPSHSLTLSPGKMVCQTIWTSTRFFDWSKLIAPHPLKNVAIPEWRGKFLLLYRECCLIIIDLAVLMGIGPRNSILFTRLFFTRRHAFAMRETRR